MHWRLAKEFAKKEFENMKKDLDNLDNISEKGSMLQVLWSKMNLDELTENIYKQFKDFKYIVPQGSVMAMLGNEKQLGSLSNCFVVGQPEDSYGSIIQYDEYLAQLMKRRAGVGLDLSLLRPRGSKVTNAAKTSTGAASFAHRYSNTTREVAQDGRKPLRLMLVTA